MDTTWLNATVLVCCSLLPNVHWSALIQNYTPAPQCWQTNSVCPGGPLGFDRGHWSTVILIQHQFKHILPGWRPTHEHYHEVTQERLTSDIMTPAKFMLNQRLFPCLIEGASPKPCTGRQFMEGRIQQCETPFLTPLRLRFQRLNSEAPILSFIWRGNHLQGRSELLAQEKCPHFELQLTRSKKVP